MQQLQLYLQQKQLEENQDREQHQRFAILAQECEQQLRDRVLRQSNTFISLTKYIEYFGYNPFDEQYINKQAILQIEHYNQIKFEQNLQAALQIDELLLQYFDKQLRCGTIAEEEDDEQNNDSDLFDCTKGLELQRELQQRRQQRPSKVQQSLSSFSEKDYPTYKQQYQFSSVKNKKQSEKKPDYSDIQDFEQKLNQVEEYEQYDDSNHHINDEDDDDIPQFGSFDSATFKQQLQHQIQHYQNELRLSKQNLETPALFQSPLKQDLLNKFQMTSDQKDEDNQQPNIVTESPQRQRQIKQIPQRQQVSLLGSLFTPAVLKEMEYLNDDIIPEQELNIPVQYQEITVERAFIEERKRKQSQMSVKSNQTHQSQFQSQSSIPQKSVESKQTRKTHPTFSPFRVQMMEEIRDALEYRPPPEDLRDGRTQLYVMQQLQSKMPEIFDLTLILAKEIQGKGYLSKQSIIKINDQYKEFSHLLMKKQPNLQQKTDNNTIISKMYEQMTEYLTPQFIHHLNLQQQQESIYLNTIFAPLVVAIAIVDKEFPRQNSKIPPVTLRLIQKVFSNPSSISRTLKSIPKLLLQREIQERDFHLFRETIQNLEDVLSNSEAVSIISNKELYNIIRQCYAIEQCFALMENLQVVNDPKLQLNNNKKYEEQWKQTGTRYASKKNKDDALSQKNQEMLEKFGIDFYAWQLNIQIQENEIKKIKRIEKEQQWKDRRAEKQEQQRAIQKENQQILHENEEQYKLNQAVKEHQKQKKTQEFREKQQSKAYSSTMVKQQQKIDEQELKKNQSSIIKQSSELLSSKQLDLKNEKDSACKYRQDRIVSARGQKLEKQTNSQKKEEEERVWQKAQELLFKQGQLLNQKKQILSQLKNK